MLDFTKSYLNSDSHQPDIESRIIRDAGRCVACGLCLPICPTYIKSRREADSPRGRIALAQALASGKLGYNQKLGEHIERCPGCRACEVMCPSLVPFEQLIRNTRTLIQRRYARLSPGNRLQVLFRRLISHHPTFAFVSRLLRLYQITGLQKLVRVTGLLKLTGLAQLERRLPSIPETARLKHYYPTPKQRVGCIALFTGCVNRVLEYGTLSATISVLTESGYDVELPEQQVCCGAIHQHAGDPHQANKCDEKNVRAFANPDYNAIVSTASGCTAVLSQNKQFTVPVMDINQFIVQSGVLNKLGLAPLSRRIVIHQPCSLQNVLNQSRSLYQLLEKIPECEIVSLADNTRCCGGAGTYPYRQPELADSLRADILTQLESLAPAILATANVSCAAHLRTGIQAAGLDIEVMHPVEILEKQLQ